MSLAIAMQPQTDISVDNFCPHGCLIDIEMSFTAVSLILHYSVLSTC